MHVFVRYLVEVLVDYLIDAFDAELEEIVHGEKFGVWIRGWDRVSREWKVDEEFEGFRC